MKVLKIIGIALVSILLIFVMVGYLQPKELNVTANKVIKAPLCVVFDHVNDMEKRVKWSPWVAADSTMEFTWTEITKGEGASYSWTSQNMGNGSMTYKEVIPNQKIVSDLNFQEQGLATGTFEFEKVEDGVLATWSFHTDMGSNPFNRLMGVVMGPMLDASFKQGLDALSKKAEADESNPCLSTNELPANIPSISDIGNLLNEGEINGVKIAEFDLPGFNFIGITDSSSVDSMGDKMGAMFGELYAYMNEIEMTYEGPAMTQYLLWDPPSKVAFTCMVPVNEPIGEHPRVKNGGSMEARVVRGTHFGSYESSEATWLAMDAYLEENNLRMAGNPFEEYMVGVTAGVDPSQFITHIYYPVKPKS